MKTSDTIGAISKSLVALQTEVTNIGKDSDGYGYKYTSLDKLLAHIKTPMTNNKLAFIQTPTYQDTKIGVTTRLIHESGEWFEDTLLMEKSTLAKMNDYQVAGSIISYFRRYAISSMIGIASDDDIDCNIKPEPKVKVKTISQEQVLTLVKLIADAETTMELMFKGLRWDLKALKDIQAANFDYVKELLEKKVKAKK